MTEQLLELVVGAPAAGGAFVGHADDGRVVFVRHALPGERVRARVTATTPSYLRADAVEVLSSSPDRVVPPCPYAGPGRCGGCDWQHVALPRQRSLKAELVAEQLARLARTSHPVVVEQVPGAPDGLGWRTRMQWAVSASGQLGLHRHRSHGLELVQTCLIAGPGTTAPLGHDWRGATEVEALSVNGQVVVSTRGRPRTLPSLDAGLVVDGRAPALPSLDAGLVVDGRPVHVPHGVAVEVLGRSFQVGAGVFWQVHPGAAAALASAVLSGLAPGPGDRIVDLYAGVGLFAALLGDAVGPTGSVLAVEGDARACADAGRNTADQPWVKVRTGTVDAALVSSRVGRPTLVVLDPPRAGAGLALSAALVSLRPRRLAYVACDPASFARDLRVFLDAGWTMPSLRAFDIFPMTEHVELVAILEPPA